MTFVVAIEGLIGAGKSTVLDHLEKLGYSVVKEPVEKWTFLDKFYENPKKYSLALQTEILMTFKEQQEAFKQDIVFIERCPQTSRYVFANLLRSMNNITNEEMSIYCDLYDSFNFKEPDMFIYLDCPVDVCLKRQIGRGDSYKVDKKYLQNLEKYYKLFLIYTKWCINVNSEKKTEEIVAEIIEKVKKRCQS